MKLKIILFLIPIIFTSGCWNYRELNEMAIVGALGIDYDEEKQEFAITAQVFNAKKTSSDSGSGSSKNQIPITVYQRSAKTIHEALRNIIFDSPKKLYIGHIDIVVLGESLIKNHLLDSMDFLFRDSESRKDFDVIVVKDNKASEVLKILTPLEGIPSTSIMETIKSNDKYKGSVSSITFDEFLSNLYNTGIEGVIPVVKINGKEKKGETAKNIDRSDPLTTLTINGLSVFKGYKLVGYLNEKESIGYSFINNKMNTTVISFPCDDDGNYGSIEIINSSSKTNIKIEENIPKVNINLKIKAALSEYNCELDLKKLDNIDKAKKQATKKIKSILKKTISTAQKKYNSDIFGFGKNLYANNYKYWKKNKDDWDKIFPELNHSIKVDLLISKKGSTTTSVKEKYYNEK